MYCDNVALIQGNDQTIQMNGFYSNFQLHTAVQKKPIQNAHPMQWRFQWLKDAYRQIKNARKN